MKYERVVHDIDNKNEWKKREIIMSIRKAVLDLKKLARNENNLKINFY